MPSDPDQPSEPDPPPEPPKQETPKQRKTGNRSGRKAGQTWFPVITKNRLFAGLLIFVASFTILAFLIRVLLAFFGKDQPTQMQAELGRGCDYIITAGFSTLIGLLAGRAASPDSIQPGHSG